MLQVFPQNLFINIINNGQQTIYNYKQSYTMIIYGLKLIQ
jgi:hypothetical protein